MKSYVRLGHVRSKTHPHLGAAPFIAILVACVVGLLVPGAARGQTAARDSLPVVKRLNFEGNAAFSDDDIKRAIVTRQSGCKSFLLSPLCWVGFGAFKRTERLQPRELRTDVLRIQIFYFRRGYRRVAVDTSVVRAGGSIDVTFLITEGPPIQVRQIELADFAGVLDSASALADLPLKAGNPFSELDLTASREALERQLKNTGYALAQVLVQASLPTSDSLGAYVVLRGVPGPIVKIGKIEVAGADDVSEDDVLRILTFRSGEIYREDEIIRSQRTLYSMALFDFVDISQSIEPSDSLIDIKVQVSEADAKSVRFGFGLTTAECFEVEAGWTHRNFFGNTRSLTLSGRLGNLGTQKLAQRFPCNQAGVDTDNEDARDAFNTPTWQLRADFQQPWFLGTENWLRLGVFGARQSLPTIYATRTYGGDITVTRQIAPATPLAFTYQPTWNTFDNISRKILFCVDLGVCQPEDIAQLEDSPLLAWVGASLSRARADAVLNPTEGYRFTIEAETASRFTGSDWAYYRTQGEISWYRPVGSRSVLALRLRGGLVRPIGSGIEGVDADPGGEGVTNPLKRQYAGGASTVRSYGQNLLGPKVLLADADSLVASSECSTSPTDVDTLRARWVCDPTGLSSNDAVPRPVGGQTAVIANLELRFPISGEVFQGATFLDLGRVWTDSPSGSRFGWAWAPGLGIRYMSPVGPLRLDVGYYTGGSEELVVVSDVGGQIVLLEDSNGMPALFDYDPYSDFLSRLQFHISIGQAF